MDVQVLEPVGARVTGLAVHEVDGEQVIALKALLAEHGVLVLPAQQADDAAFLAFLRRFGEIAFTTGETAVDGFPDLNVVSNVGMTRTPRSSYHVDTSYVREPPAYTALRAVLIPEQGGQTLFTDQRRALAELPQDVRDRIEGQTIRHVVTGLELGPDDEVAADHPVVRPHPVAGEPSLYLTSPARCASMSSLPDDEASELIALLYAHCTRDAYRHSWSAGDVVMWDNSCVLHKADHSGVVGDRVMHRGMVAGY